VPRCLIGVIGKRILRRRGEDGETGRRDELRGHENDFNLLHLLSALLDTNNRTGVKCTRESNGGLYNVAKLVF